MCDIAKKLDVLKPMITKEVAKALAGFSPNANYTIVWKAYQDKSAKILRRILIKYIKCLSDKNFYEGEEKKNKNAPADLAIVCKEGSILISIKSARRSANPGNDLGTFVGHQIRQRDFLASFDLWIKYDDSGKKLKTDRVFFDRSYKFVGKSREVNGVKYRIGAGNFRPKSWKMFEAEECHWNTEEEFNAAVERSSKYRASKIVDKYLKDIEEDVQRSLYLRLKSKFGRL